ncbi:hypothetical protein BH23ACT9_BH23ACT9_39230 [soil metagenome]
MEAAPEAVAPVPAEQVAEQSVTDPVALAEPVETADPGVVPDGDDPTDRTDA